MISFQRVLAVVLILSGSIFFLQGINVLPGSFMTGHLEWAYVGAAAVLAGIILILTSRGRAADPEAGAPGKEDTPSN